MKDRAGCRHRVGSGGAANATWGQTVRKAQAREWGAGMGIRPNVWVLALLLSREILLSISRSLHYWKPGLC
jgi:hypothetical protein